MVDLNFDNENIFLTPNQAAKVLNVSLVTLKKFIYSGKIRTLKTPGGHHRILRADLFSMQTKSPHVPDLTADLMFKSVNDIIDELISDLDVQRKHYSEHASAVSKISMEIACALKLSPKTKAHLKVAALLHDVGFLGISENILNKPGTLNRVEYIAVKTHPLIGEEIVHTTKPLNGISHIIRQHHERYDGRGYPDGLAQEEIALEARIISLAEAFDSIASQYSYQSPISKGEAFEIISEESGKQFDPEIVKVFLEIERPQRNGRRKNGGHQ